LDRFDADNFDSKSTVYGCFLEHPGLFDHKLFNVSPREAIQMDPGQRLLLHTTYEALEDAGITANGTHSTDAKRVSTFIGVGADDWRELHQSLGVDSHWIHGNERAFGPGRLNHYFKWEGATFCVDSACASAATAMALAFKALINRDCDTAIVGGANIIATPFWHSALSRGGFLSLTGGCKTFREDADGYCRGEAVGVLVLKRHDDALQDNDKVVSVIRGYARNHSAESTSITHPHARTQERLYRSLLHKTGLEPHDIGYVEFHGTGTTAGDSTELESISNVFTKTGSRQKPLVVGAIKANIGHSEAVGFP
jgi:acyl transferase domain-containing protein